jgi:hypothetical protein
MWSTTAVIFLLERVEVATRRKERKIKNGDQDGDHRGSQNEMGGERKHVQIQKHLFYNQQLTNQPVNDTMTDHPTPPVAHCKSE